jgi:ribosome recycling factor
MDRLIARMRSHMEKSIEAMERDFATVRTGRASPALLDHVTVDYYGTQMPVSQVATVSVPEARLMVIAPWDKTMVNPIQKAIMTSDLGLTPSSDGNVIRLAVPQLTEERRKEMTKLVGKKAEEGRVAIRNIRRETIEELRRMEKSQGLSEDEVKRGEEKIQEIHDEFIRRVDELREAKVRELMEV